MKNLMMVHPLVRSLWFSTLLLGSAIVPSLGAADCDLNQLFSPAANVPSGPSPHDVLLRDLDGDGKLDMVVANSGNNSVSVHRGLGDGSFAAPNSYAAGPGAYALAMGDFNEDGITDLAVADNGVSSVAILLGLGSSGVGNGAFGPLTSFPCGDGPFRIATRDFNEDGITDLVVANNRSANLSILIGLGSAGVGNGTFAGPVNYATGPNPSGVATGDFNSDGITDLAGLNYSSNTISILLGQGAAGVGNGTFAPAATLNTGSLPFHIVAADVNEDGITDLLSANQPNVSVFLGRGSGGMGNGTFDPAVNYPSGGEGGVIALVDVNQDGITDLAVSNSTGRVAILIGGGTGGVGNGTFQNVATYAVGSYAIGITAGDLNGDGRVDLATPNFGGGGVSILLGRCVTPLPQLTDVRDVPNDNGGKVFLTWLASNLDNPQDHAITGYRVWRRIPPALAMEAASRSVRSSAGASAAPDARTTEIDGKFAVRRIERNGNLEVTYWEALVTLPAEFLAGYGYTAPTTQDSIHDSNPYTAFFVTALTAQSYVFYESNIDSGYSVDNIRPHRPNSFEATFDASGAALQWEANSETDLAGYRIYRGPNSGFEPSNDNLIATTSDPAYVDGSGSQLFAYKLTGVDIHGNESDPALIEPSAQLGIDPASFRLSLDRARFDAGARRLLVDLTLPGAAPATLELLDLGGRRIESRRIEALGAGHHQIELGTGSELRPGMYFVRLIQAGRSLTAKTVVLR